MDDLTGMPVLDADPLRMTQHAPRVGRIRRLAHSTRHLHQGRVLVVCKRDDALTGLSKLAVEELVRCQETIIPFFLSILSAIAVEVRVSVLLLWALALGSSICIATVT